MTPVSSNTGVNPEAFQVLFVRTEVAYAGRELSQADDAPSRAGGMGSGEESKALAHDFRGAPAEVPSQSGQNLPIA